MYRQALILIIFLEVTFSFKPRTFEIFEKNCLRLLANRQYSFLSDYFLKHAEHFHTDQRSVDMGLKVVRNSPLPKINFELLTYLLKLKSPKLNKREVFFECGLLHYFEARWLKAARFFTLSHRGMANYYLGECLFKLGDFQKAKNNFNLFIKNTQADSSIMPLARFKLAAIAYQEKKYRKSYRLLLKSQYYGVDRNILLYRIYEKNGETKLKKKVISTLKTKYRNNIKVKVFLDELP